MAYGANFFFKEKKKENPTMIILIKKELDNYQRKKKVVLKMVVYIGYITVHLFILFQTHNQTKGFFND